MALATAVRTRCPAPLLTALRDVTGQHQDWTRTAELVAAQLRAHLPGPDLLTPLVNPRGDDGAARGLSVV